MPKNAGSYTVKGDTSGVRLELPSLPSPQWLAQVNQALAMQVR